jgi:hypothetical protein
MKRTTLLQNLIDTGKYKTYLEIGTHKGMSLFPLKCKYKIAVDPSFKISSKDKKKWLLKNPYNFRNKYFDLTSDDFFKQNENDIRKQDLIFIDGLHTFEASLKDVLNSLKHLKSNGVIMMHDCFPPHEVAAMPLGSFEEGKKRSIKGWNGEWCGDVWKTISYLKENYADVLDIFVLDTDYGLGIVKLKNETPSILDLNKESYERINKLDYQYLMSNPEEIIALKDKSYATQLLKSIKK